MSGLLKGVVYRSTGSWYSVKTGDGNFYQCRLKGRFRIMGIRATNPVAVGDVVYFSVLKDKDAAVIQKIEPRRNYLIRKATKLSKAVHIIAANVDAAMLIASIEQPRTTTGFIDRFLVTAEAYHIPVTIVFNKYDLLGDDSKKRLGELMEAYSAAGYKCLVTSVPENLNIDKVKELLKGKTTLLSGHSGVGKSAIINKTDPNLNLKTGEISKAHKKGKHTTTFAEMFDLEFGGAIIDTPGIKEFGLVNFEKTELGHRFPEFREYLPQCRFNDCLHLNEPDCAVREAVEQGKIAGFRYKNYLNMLEDLGESINS